MILKENLIDLKEVMIYNETTKSLIAEIKKEMEEKISKIKEERKVLEYEAKENELKSKIIESAKKEFKETSNKKLLGGIGIREVKEYGYCEEDAFKWAKEHSLCLQLDKKAFEGLAKTQNFDFVEVGNIVQVTFPKEIFLLEEVK